MSLLSWLYQVFSYPYKCFLLTAWISNLTDGNLILISMLGISISIKVSCLQVTSVALVSAYSLAWHCVNTVARAVVSVVQVSILKLEIGQLWTTTWTSPPFPYLGEQHCLDGQPVWSEPGQPDPLTCQLAFSLDNLEKGPILQLVLGTHLVPSLGNFRGRVFSNEKTNTLLWSAMLRPWWWPCEGLLFHKRLWICLDCEKSNDCEAGLWK